VYAAMKSLGWIVPQCERDVRGAEKELPATAEALPEALREAGAVFDGKVADDGTVGLNPATPTADTGVDENLARAAREGGTIGPAIEARMRRDREAAERRRDDSDNGPDVG